MPKVNNFSYRACCVEKYGHKDEELKRLAERKKEFKRRQNRKMIREVFDRKRRERGD